MATLPLMLTMPMATLSSPQLQELLSQLEPNVAPAAPSVWPLAIGYWLILVVVLLLMTLAGFFWYQGRHWRSIEKKLSQIKNNPEPIEELHQLLRWVLITQLNAPKNMDNQAFEQKISQTMKGSLPTWVNAHYRAQNHTEVNWSEVKHLLQSWKKEAQR